MFNKVLLALILLGGVAAVFLFNHKSSKENFWNTPSRQWKSEKILGSGDPVKGDFFQSPNFQSILSPRFSNVNYGPYLQTALPPYNMTGVPQDPLNAIPPPSLGVPLAERYRLQNQLANARRDDALFAAGAVSGRPFSAYGGGIPPPVCGCGVAGCGGSCGVIAPLQVPPVCGCGVAGCGGGCGVIAPLQVPPVCGCGVAGCGGGCGYALPPLKPLYGRAGPGIPIDPHARSAAYANGNFDQVVANVSALGGGPLPTSTILEGPATVPFLSTEGEMIQPIVFDRYMFANRRSRLRSQGDPIRGDLPIVPLTGQWFVPSVAPNLDLQAGAINVLAGVNNETNHQLANLIYNSSGGGEMCIGGVDMSQVNMTHQVLGASSAARGDINMTAFP